MNFKIFGLLGALILAAPAAAVAAPAGALTAHGYSDLATAQPAVADAAVAPGENTAKIEKVWWRRGGWGWGWRRPYWGGYYGWRRPYWGGYYGWHRPYWRRRFFY